MYRCERRMCVLHVAQVFTIERDWWSCREAGAHQSAEHDLCTVPPCDFPAAAVNLLPNLCSCVSVARTKPLRGEEMREEGGERVLTLPSILYNLIVIIWLISFL